MLRTPVHAGFSSDMSDLGRSSPEAGAAAAGEDTPFEDFYGCRQSSSAASWKGEDYGPSSSSSSVQLEPERPRYLWEHIPPRLAPAAGDDDLLELPADDDGFDVDYDPAPPAAACWWDSPSSSRKREDHHSSNPISSRLSVSINTGCGNDPERRPLHHSGGGLAASGAAQQIDIGLPAAADPRRHIQLEISGCPASLTVSVTTKREPTPVSTRSGLSRGCVDSTRVSSRRCPESFSSPACVVEPALPVEDDQKVLARALGYLKESGWYYGPLSWQQAQLCLQGTPEGTFLARDSLHKRFVFALSVQTSRGPTSVRIQLVGGRFRLDAPSDLAMPAFSDINRLVEHYARKGPFAVDGLPSLTMRLRKPLLKQAPALQHLCRLALNKAKSSGNDSASSGSSTRTTGVLPQALEQYLDQYPYTR